MLVGMWRAHPGILVVLICLPLASEVQGQWGNGFFPDTYHPYVEECLRGGKNENPVREEDLQSVLDQLVRLGEFGGAIDLLKSRGDSLSFHYRYLLGVLLEEVGQGAQSSAVFLSLARDMAANDGREMWGVEMLRGSENRIPQAYNHVVRRPVMHFRNGLEDVFGTDGCEDLAARVHVHLAVSFEAGSRRESISRSARDSVEGNEGLFFREELSEDYDLPMFRGNTLVANKQQSEEWLAETFHFFRKTAPEFSLIAMSKMKVAGMNAPVPDQEVVPLVDSIEEVNEKSLRSIAVMLPDFPGLEKKALALFSQAKDTGQILSSRTFLALAEVMSPAGLEQLVEEELNNFPAIRRHQFMKLEPDFDHLWPGCAGPLMNSGLSLSLLIWISLDYHSSDLDFKNVNHPAFHLALADRRGDITGIEKALLELMSSGEASYRMVAASYLGEIGKLDQALKILTDLEKVGVEVDGKRRILQAQIDFCVRHRESETTSMDSLAHRSTLALQFLPLGDFDRNRLIDSMWTLGLERNIKIDQSRFRGYRGLSHPGDRDEWSRGPADRSVRLASLEMLLSEKPGLIFGIEGPGRRGSYRTRVSLRNSDQETSRYAMASMLSGRAGDSTAGFFSLMKNYPGKSIYQQRWVESGLIGNEFTIETLKTLEGDPALRGRIFSQIENLKGDGRELIESIFRRLSFGSSPELRAEVIALAEKSFLNPGPSGVRRYRVAADPFANPVPFRGGGSQIDSSGLLEMLYAAPEISAGRWLVLAFSSQGLIFEKRRKMSEILDVIAEDIAKKKESRGYEAANSFDSRLLALAVIEGCIGEAGFEFSDLEDFIQTLHERKVDDWWEKLSKLNALRKGEPDSLKKAEATFTREDKLFDPVLPLLQSLSEGKAVEND